MTDATRPKSHPPVLIASVDATEISRIRILLNSPRGPAFISRLLTSKEKTRLSRMTAARRAEFIAGRFAAKEAVIKILKFERHFGGTLLDIEILTRASGAPTVKLSGHAADLARALGVHKILLSLSHTKTTAFALALGIGSGQKKSNVRIGVARKKRRFGSTSS